MYSSARLEKQQRLVCTSIPSNTLCLLNLFLLQRYGIVMLKGSKFSRHFFIAYIFFDSRKSEIRKRI